MKPTTLLDLLPFAFQSENCVSLLNFVVNLLPLEPFKNSSPVYDFYESRCRDSCLMFLLDNFIFLFYQVVNKWFALQAVSDVPGNVENVRKLLNHPAFDLRNPNKVSVMSVSVQCLHAHSCDLHSSLYVGELCAHSLRVWNIFCNRYTHSLEDFVVLL